MLSFLYVFVLVYETKMKNVNVDPEGSQPMLTNSFAKVNQHYDLLLYEVILWLMPLNLKVDSFKEK